MIKKIIGIFTAIVLLSFSFTSCNDLSEKNEDSTPSLTLSEYAVEITSAMAAVTTHKITAKVENSSSKVYWTSSNKQIATVSNDGSGTTVVTVQGAGTAVISAKTEDGKLQKNCYVTITLTSMKPTPVSELVVEDITSTTVTLSWEKPSVAGQVLIEVYDITGLGTVNIEDLTPFSQHYVDVTKRSYTVENLITNRAGTKKYRFYVYGYLNGMKSEGVYVDKTLLADKEVPGSVDVTYKTTDHGISFSWKNPSDDDYAGVKIVTADKNLFGESYEDVVRTSAYTTASYELLKANTDYTFYFLSYDVNGNWQTKSEETKVVVTTAQDTTATAAVSNATASYLTNGKIYVSWTDPKDKDFKYVKVTPNSTDAGTVPSGVNVDAGKQDCTFECDTEHTFTFTVAAVDYDGNESSVTVKPVKPVVKNLSVAASSLYTGIDVKWTVPDITESNREDYDYSYTVKVYEGNSLIKTVDNIAYDQTSYTVSEGLETGKPYSFEVITNLASKENNSETASFSLKYDSTVSMVYRTVVFWTNNRSGWVIPTTDGKVYYTSGTVEDEIASVKNASYSAKFVVRPPFAASDSAGSSYFAETEPFSLQATDASGNPVDKYLSFTKASASSTGILYSKSEIESKSLQTVSSFYQSDWSNNSTQTVPEGATVCNVRCVEGSLHWRLADSDSSAVVLEANTGRRGIGSFLYGIKFLEQ